MHCKLKEDELRIGSEEERGKADDDRKKWQGRKKDGRKR
jgi:hypothetical protein